MTRRESRLFRLLLAMLLPVMASSCGNRRGNPPPDVIGEDTLVQVLVDFHLARARAQASPLEDHAEQKKELYYREALDRHGLTYERLRTSLDFYAKQPESFTVIYDRVIEELNRKQAEAAAG